MLSSNELAVLSALWSVDRPLTRTEILQRITKTDWNPWFHPHGAQQPDQKGLRSGGRDRPLRAKLREDLLPAEKQG